MANPYEPVIAALRGRSITAQFQSPWQLVVSRQLGAVWPNRGNSFWITNAQGIWYLSTWSPVCYRVPDSSKIADVCADCMERGDQAMYRVPNDLVAKYHLKEISASEFDKLVPPEGTEGDGAV